VVRGKHDGVEAIHDVEEDQVLHGGLLDDGAGVVSSRGEAGVTVGGVEGDVMLERDSCAGLV
jgi:hypothetical protein